MRSIRSVVFPALLLAASSAGAIEVFKAQEVEVYRGDANADSSRNPFAAPSNDRQARPSPQPAAQNASQLFGVWQTNIPGAVYTVPSGVAGYDRLIVSSGAAAGLFRLNPDGTYVWNSYGGKRGKWERSNDPEYPVEIIDTVENRRWKVGFDARAQVLRIWSGSFWYEGRPAQVGNQNRK